MNHRHPLRALHVFMTFQTYATTPYLQILAIRGGESPGDGRLRALHKLRPPAQGLLVPM